MTGKFTRRKLAAALAAPAAALAQPQAQLGAVADNELKAARDRIANAAAALAKQELPMTAEPAFQFKA